MPCGASPFVRRFWHPACAYCPATWPPWNLRHISHVSYVPCRHCCCCCCWTLGCWQWQHRQQRQQRQQKRQQQVAGAQPGHRRGAGPPATPVSSLNGSNPASSTGGNAALTGSFCPLVGTIDTVRRLCSSGNLHLTSSSNTYEWNRPTSHNVSGTRTRSGAAAPLSGRVVLHATVKPMNRARGL